MIKELRIGNIIKIGNVTTVVEGFCIWDNLVQTSNFAERDIKEFEPILLTEEWLVRLGLERSKLLGYYYVGNISVNKDMLCCVGDYGGELPHIKYVHQLQNLIHALTGEELIIK
jgi:hypothetical protein